MCQVNNFNYTEWCNELIITIDNSVELMTLIIIIQTQLVNYTLVPHNTENVKTPSIKRPNSPQKPLSHIRTVSLLN